MKKVKYPAKAALARFIPIRNHLTNMAEFLLQAGARELAERAIDFRSEIAGFELEIEILAQAERRGSDLK